MTLMTNFAKEESLPQVWIYISTVLLSISQKVKPYFHLHWINFESSMFFLQMPRASIPRRHLLKSYRTKRIFRWIEWRSTCVEEGSISASHILSLVRPASSKYLNLAIFNDTWDLPKFWFNENCFGALFIIESRKEENCSYFQIFYLFSF